MFFFFKQKTAYDMRISDWSSDGGSSGLQFLGGRLPGTPLRPWLKRVAANAAIDRIRRDKRLVALDDDDAQPADGPEPALHAESAGLLRRLTPVERTVIWLHAMEGWSHPELGRRFGHSESWSKSIVSRGLSRLRLDRKSTRMNSSH